MYLKTLRAPMRPGAILKTPRVQTRKNYIVLYMLYIVTNCDDKYLTYLIPLLRTIIQNVKINYHLVCGLINSDKDKIINNLFTDRPSILEIVHQTVPNNTDALGFYANSKLILIDKVLNQTPDGTYVLYLDTDSFVLKDLSKLIDDYSKYDLTIFDKALDPITSAKFKKLCNSSRFKTKYCSGVMLFKNSSKIRVFTRDMVEYLKSYGLGKWFSDQQSLHRAIKVHEPNIKIGQLPMSYIDWTCSQNSYIITSKGTIKETNTTFLRLLKIFKDNKIKMEDGTKQKS